MPDEKPLHVRVAEALGWQRFPYTLANVPWWEQPCCPPGAEVHISTTELIPRYDTDWSATGPLIERYVGSLTEADSFQGWGAWPKAAPGIPWSTAKTPLEAVCHLILALAEAGKLS